MSGIEELVARLEKARRALGHIEGHPQYSNDDPIVEVSQTDLRALLDAYAEVQDDPRQAWLFQERWSQASLDRAYWFRRASRWKSLARARREQVREKQSEDRTMLCLLNAARTELTTANEAIAKGHKDIQHFKAQLLKAREPQANRVTKQAGVNRALRGTVKALQAELKSLKK